MGDLVVRGTSLRWPCALGTLPVLPLGFHLDFYVHTRVANNASATDTWDTTPARAGRNGRSCETKDERRP